MWQSTPQVAPPPVPAPPTYPPMAMSRKNNHPKINLSSAFLRGALFMMSRSGGLKPRTVAGRPSVDPHELDRNQIFCWETQSSSQDDGNNFTNVGGNQVSDKPLHVLL